jgi:hypothetical protein
MNFFKGFVVDFLRENPVFSGTPPKLKEKKSKKPEKDETVYPHDINRGPRQPTGRKF